MSSQVIELRPILKVDFDDVALFLHEHLNGRVSPDSWKRLLAPPWRSESPNSGFQLLTGGRIVGVYAAVYSERDVEGESLRFCNLAAFCVLHEHRAHSFRLLRTILGQKGYEFTDLSPSGNVIALNERLGFARLDTSTTVALNLPALPKRGVTISSASGVLETTLKGADAAIYRDHRDAAAARHVVITRGDDYAYLVFRKDRRKRLPIFATPLYVGGSRELLRAAWPRIAAHLLLRHGLAATLAEPRVLGFTPKLGRKLSTPRTKMFRSKTVPADRLDYLYSELTLLEW